MISQLSAKYQIGAIHTADTMWWFVTESIRESSSFIPAQHSANSIRWHTQSEFPTVSVTGCVLTYPDRITKPDTRANRDTGVTVWACMRFACVIRSGYLVLANQHTSSDGQGSRDLRQTRVEPYWIEIVGHSSTKHQFSLPLRIFNRL